jgi:Sulfotransferase family
VTVRVLYIGGSGRSGSTLLDRVLGQIPGFVSTGELNVLPQAALGENRLCGCGLPFDACPFWAGVGQTAFRGWSAVQSADLQTAMAFSDVEALRLLLGGRPRSRPRADQALSRLYHGISEQAGGATVVDSSKAPRYAALLATIPGLDLRVIHLVRDSRGVAYSWGKVVKRPDVPGRDVEMLRMGAAAVGARWLMHNAMMEMLSRRVPVARLSYERFLAKPRDELRHVLSRLTPDLPPTALDFLHGSTVHLEPDHTVMGNPMRLQTGDVPLRLDDAWTSAMAGMPKAVVTAMTWPLLLRYGYPLTGKH